MFDTIENQIKRAEHAINDLSKNPNECEWFQILLDLLKDKKIKFLAYDDKYEPELTYENIEKLIHKNKTKRNFFI